MTDAKTFMMSTMRPFPPNEAIGAFTVGSIETITIFTMTGPIPTMIATIVGSTKAGTREEGVVRHGGMLNSPGVTVVGNIGTDRDDMTTVVTLGFRNDPSSEETCVAFVPKE